VNNPEGEMLPAITDQVMAVFELPLTAAVNCTVPPPMTVVVAGVSAIETPVPDPLASDDGTKTTSRK
jgi:hypothetical protein